MTDAMWRVSQQNEQCVRVNKNLLPTKRTPTLCASCLHVSFFKTFPTTIANATFWQLASHINGTVAPREFLNAIFFADVHARNTIGQETCITISVEGGMKTDREKTLINWKTIAGDISHVGLAGFRACGWRMF